MSFLRSVFSVSALSIVGRITGYMRDFLLAHLIGANATSDAISLAIKIPSFFRRIFAEGALNVSFLPAYTHTNKSKIFAGMVLSLLTCTLALLVCVLEWYYVPMVEFFWSGYPSETLGYLKKFGPIIFPYIFFISLASFFGSILNAHSQFFATSISSAMGNISTLVFVLIFCIWTKQYGLVFSWGLLLSGVTQFIFLFLI